MAQRLLNVRVRPPRATVLLSRDAGIPGFLTTVEFFSKLWGGRYGQILVVDPKGAVDLDRLRLSDSRPEFIYGVGVDHEHWARTVSKVCQPRRYGELTPEIAKDIKKASYEDYLRVDHALGHLFRTRDQNPRLKRVLRLVTADASLRFAPYYAAMYGIPSPNLRDDHFDEKQEVARDDAFAFLGLAMRFASLLEQPWLDVTAHELHANVHGTAWWVSVVPMIVLVDHPITDLSLFWNLRAVADPHLPAWIIPIPVQDASQPEVLAKLREWIFACPHYGFKPTLCLVTSDSLAAAPCRQFATDFAAILADTTVKRVEYEPPRDRLPLVIPYEYEEVWAVDITGQRLTMRPPQPKAFDNVRKAWIVDLLKDVKTGRAVKDLKLPSSPVVLELLNGPSPPIFETNAVLRTGDGAESINIRCSKMKDVVNVHLPSSQEIVEEILREHGIEPRKDEKRSGYLPVIRRFGGILNAAGTFTGKSREVLMAIEKEPLTVPEIKGTCHLGNGNLPGKTFLESIDWIFQTKSARMKRVGQQRFAKYAQNEAPENLRITSFLEYWADRAILTRRWKIGPCRACGRTSYKGKLDIRKRILCPSCGNRVDLPDRVPLGYLLNPSVRLAIREGMIPVTLTGRFLYKMTSDGFFWLPGVKVREGETHGDVDLIACCDGYMVFGECKKLDETPAEAKVWDDVVSQFLRTVALAKKCEAHLVVLAGLVTEFPQDVKDRIYAGVGGSIPILLLNKQDLEDGRRVVEDDGPRPMRVSDAIPHPYAPKPS